MSYHGYNRSRVKIQELCLVQSSKSDELGIFFHLCLVSVAYVDLHMSPILLIGFLELEKNIILLVVE